MQSVNSQNSGPVQYKFVVSSKSRLQADGKLTAYNNTNTGIRFEYDFTAVALDSSGSPLGKKSSIHRKKIVPEGGTATFQDSLYIYGIPAGKSATTRVCIENASYSKF